jgi:hypothetical protein
MTVTIRPEQEEIISEALKTGHYESAQFERGEFYTPEQARAETERRKALNPMSLILLHLDRDLV